uniref:F-box domain-containing protein n=1 Tax=Calidris pygmaea TaxID=425635 RepID=A0A8C3JAG9_9CHAR
SSPRPPPPLDVTVPRPRCRAAPPPPGRDKGAGSRRLRLRAGPTRARAPPPCPGLNHAAAAALPAGAPPCPPLASSPRAGTGGKGGGACCWGYGCHPRAPPLPRSLARSLSRPPARPPRPPPPSRRRRKRADPGAPLPPPPSPPTPLHPRSRPAAPTCRRAERPRRRAPPPGCPVPPGWGPSGPPPRRWSRGPSAPAVHERESGAGAAARATRLLPAGGGGAGGSEGWRLHVRGGGGAPEPPGQPQPAGERARGTTCLQPAPGGGAGPACPLEAARPPAAAPGQGAAGSLPPGEGGSASPPASPRRREGVRAVNGGRAQRSPSRKNVKAFASSDSLAKVQEVASWLLEMNQELLSVGSKRRRTGGSLRGNASSSQVDEEQMNRVVEEEEQQQRRQQEEQHIGRNGEIGEEPGFDDRHESQQEQLEENNNRLITVDEESTCNQDEEDDEHAGDQEEEVEEEEEMDQESDDFDQSDDSSREDERANSNSVTNSNSLMDLPIHQSSPFYIKTKMKRKLDHGSEVRSFSLGKKPCKVSEYTSTTGLVPCSATPTTFGDLRAANGQGQQRRRITSVQPPTGLQEWLKMFQSWSGPEKLLALDELIDSCEPTQVKHMMQVIEPQFQRDFISLLPKELALYVLSFLEPRDLLQAAQTCRYWRILAEDNLLWREKCKEEGKAEEKRWM